MSKHYKVEVTLSEVTPQVDQHGYARGVASQIHKVEVTAGSPASAVRLAAQHVDVLKAWHREDVVVDTAEVRA